MASSLLLSPPSAPTSSTELVGSSINQLSKSSFFSNPKLLFLTNRRSPGRVGVVQQRCYKPTFASLSRRKNLDHIPKQFREENLKDGLMENYKNAPQYLYGLPPSQLALFSNERNPFHRLSQSLTEESISSTKSYADHGGLASPLGIRNKRTSMYSMFDEELARARPRTPPPDLPSIMLDARIIILALPIVPAVTELLVAEFMYLEFLDSSKPIHLYIDSTGTENDKREPVGGENDAFAIADCIALCKAPVHTLNVSRAFGQAAMLLSVGEKGHRGVLEYSYTSLHLPKTYKLTGPVIDMWIRAKEFESNTEYFLEFLSEGTGKSKEELNNDLQFTKYLNAQATIDYGVADMIVHTLDEERFYRRDYVAMAEKMRALRSLGRRPPNM